MKQWVCTLAIVAMLAVSVLPIGAAPNVGGEKPFVVTFLFADHWNDEGWNLAHKTGVDALLKLGEVVKKSEQAYIIKLKGTKYPELDGRVLEIHFVTNVGYGSEIEGTMQKALETQHPDLLFGTWFNAKDAIATLAPKYPNVNFEHCSGYPLLKSTDSPAGNISTYFIKMEDGDYAVGYAAGLTGKNKIGLVATYPIPEPVRGVNGFILGLKKGLAEAGQDPATAQVQVVWIESWLDVQKEQLATQTLIDMGYKTIRQMPDTPTTALTACNAKVDALGYGSDVLPKAPCALVTNTWRWGNYYTERVLDAMKGTWKPQDWFEGWNKDAIGLVWNPTAPADVKQKTEALALQMKQGLTDPFTGPIAGRGKDKDGKETAIKVPAGQRVGDMGRLTMQWFVNGILSNLPDYPSGGHDLDLQPVK